MTPQDTQLLQDFLNQLTRAQVATKDREAQTLIARAFAQQPDAAYLVVQRALLLEQALKQAQAQIAQFQQQSSSFVGTRAWNPEPTPNPGAIPRPPMRSRLGPHRAAPRQAARGARFSATLLQRPLELQGAPSYSTASRICSTTAADFRPRTRQRRRSRMSPSTTTTMATTQQIGSQATTRTMHSIRSTPAIPATTCRGPEAKRADCVDLPSVFFHHSRCVADVTIGKPV